MDDLQKELTGPWIEDEDGTIDWLSSQIPFKSLMDRHTVDVGVINEELNLIAEELRVVLRVEKLLVAF